MVYCSAHNCNSNSSDSVKHRWPSFPGNNPALKDRWVKLVGKGGWIPSKHSVICEKHFSADAWFPCSSGDVKKRLKPESLPNLVCRCDFRGVSSRNKPLSSVLSDHNFATPTPRRPRILSGAHRDKENVTFQPSAEPASKRRGRTSFDRVVHSISCPFRDPDPTSASQDFEKSSTSQLGTTSSVLQSNAAARFMLASPDSNNAYQEPSHTPASIESVLAPTVPASTTLSEDPDPTTVYSSRTVPVSTAVLEEPVPTFTTNTLPTSSSLPSVERESLNEKLKRMEKLAPKLQGQVNNLTREKERYRTKYRRSEERYQGLTLNLKKRFGEDQLNALATGNSRGRLWQQKTIFNALKLHFPRGTVGYEAVSDTQMPLPSIPVVNKNIQHLKFPPGLLYEILKLLPIKRRFMVPDFQADCCLTFDEMALVAKREMDRSLKALIGNCTVPMKRMKVTTKLKERFNYDIKKAKDYIKKRFQESLHEKASKALLFMIGGLFSRWKQIIQYDFTGASTDGETVKNSILNIVRETGAIGVKVKVVTCDMGNRHVWEELGIKCRQGDIVNSIPHPFFPDERLYFMADSVHLYKNHFCMFASNKIIVLPHDVVEAYDLPTNEVLYSHLLFLQEYQKDMHWKLAPKLPSTDLDASHFKKMKVTNATSVINHRTAAALYFLADLLKMPELRTTAWYINLCHLWFKLMTSRSPSLALSKKRPEIYEDSIDTLKVCMHVFENMKVGDPAEWKPVQSGVIMSTKTIVELAGDYFEGENPLPENTMLMTGKTTQDMNENAFSVVRNGCKYPTPKMFKTRLRKMAISHFSRKIPGSSYEFDDREDLVDFFSSSGEPLPPSVERDGHSVQEGTLSSVRLDFSSVLMAEKEKPAFYFVCGYLIAAVLRENASLKTCPFCYPALLNTNPNPNQVGLFLRLCNYTTDNLTEVSDSVFQLLLTCEERLFHLKKELDFEKSENLSLALQQLLQITSHLPECHNVREIVIKRFFKMRTLLGWDPCFEVSEDPASHFSSMTMGAKYLADRLKFPKKTKS